jgi:hypothetical protein
MKRGRAPERSASGEIFMRYVAIFVFLTLAGCHIDTVPQSAITPSAMTETYVRIGLYYQQHNKLPASLDVLPSGRTTRRARLTSGAVRSGISLIPRARFPCPVLARTALAGEPARIPISFRDIGS